MAKRIVKVKIDGMQNGELTVAGGNVVENAHPNVQLDNNGGDVDLEAKNISGKVVAAGGDVVKFANQVMPLDELAELLKSNLSHQNQIEHLQEVVKDLKYQINASIDERSESKIKILLNNLANFLSLATLATTQAGKARQLFEVVKNLLPG